MSVLSMRSFGAALRPRFLPARSGRWESCPVGDGSRRRPGLGVERGAGQLVQVHRGVVGHQHLAGGGAGQPADRVARPGWAGPPSDPRTGPAPYPTPPGSLPRGAAPWPGERAERVAVQVDQGRVVQREPVAEPGQGSSASSFSAYSRAKDTWDIPLTISPRPTPCGVRCGCPPCCRSLLPSRLPLPAGLPRRGDLRRVRPQQGLGQGQDGLLQRAELGGHVALGGVGTIFASVLLDLVCAPGRVPSGSSVPLAPGTGQL